MEGEGAAELWLRPLSDTRVAIKEAALHVATGTFAPETVALPMKFRESV